MGATQSVYKDGEDNIGYESDMDTGSGENGSLPTMLTTDSDIAKINISINKQMTENKDSVIDQRDKQQDECNTKDVTNAKVLNSMTPMNGVTGVNEQNSVSNGKHVASTSDAAAILIKKKFQKVDSRRSIKDSLESCNSLPSLCSNSSEESEVIIPTIMVKRASLADVAIVATTKANSDSALADLRAEAEKRIANSSQRSRNVYIHPFGKNPTLIEELLYGAPEKFVAHTVNPGKQVIWLIFLGLLMGVAVVVIFLAETSRAARDTSNEDLSTALPSVNNYTAT